MKSYRSGLVGVFGCPVDENPSVVMNEAAFRAMGLDYRYLTIKVKPEELKTAFAGLRAMHFTGINLTIPHKIPALSLVDELSISAKMIGAVNIIVRWGNNLYGDNTDGKGMVESLNEAGQSLRDKCLVVLGTGGAARAICVEAALAGCRLIHILGRTPERAADIAAIINSETKAAATFSKWEKEAAIPECDILINATPIGLAPDKGYPDICYETIRPGMFVQDVIPNPADTPFLQRARKYGAITGNGLGMLVFQGAIGIKLWTREKAPIDVMKQALEKEFRL